MITICHFHPDTCLSKLLHSELANISHISETEQRLVGKVAFNIYFNVNCRKPIDAATSSLLTISPVSCGSDKCLHLAL